jgi:hypothetical protein
MENEFDNSVHSILDRDLLLKRNWIRSLHLRMVRIWIRYRVHCIAGAKKPYFCFTYFIYKRARYHYKKFFPYRTCVMAYPGQKSLTVSGLEVFSNSLSGLLATKMAKKEIMRSVIFLVPALPLPGTEQWREQVLESPQLLPRVLKRDLNYCFASNIYIGYPTHLRNIWQWQKILKTYLNP